MDASCGICSDPYSRIFSLPFFCLSGFPRATWEFAVSGHRVLPRWVDGRKG